MSCLLQLLQSLIQRAEPRHGVDEAYLADAVDIYDLERRMRSLDERSRGPSSGIALNLSNH